MIREMDSIVQEFINDDWVGRFVCYYWPAADVMEISWQ